MHISLFIPLSMLKHWLPLWVHWNMPTYSSFKIFKYDGTSLNILWKNMKYANVFVLTNTSKYGYLCWQRIYAEIRSYSHWTWNGRNVVYFDQRMHTCARVPMAENDQKHSKMSKKVPFSSCVWEAYKEKRRKKFFFFF